MGRFGMHEFATGWENAHPGVRVLIPRDSLRLALTLAAIAITASLPNAWAWPWLVAAAIVPLAVLIGARVPFRFTARRLAVVAPFGLLATLFLPWAGGDPRIEWLGLSLSQPGLIQAVAILLKLTAACLWICYLVATTTVPGIFAALRALKSQLRSTWTRPMAAEQSRLCTLKSKATRRYCLLAATRGRQHLADAERNQVLALAVAPAYEVARFEASEEVETQNAVG